jgi:putative ABC transport system permease protein
VLPRDGRAASILGDLLEAFAADVARGSRRRAAAKYWRAALSIALGYAIARAAAGAAPRPPAEEKPAFLDGIAHDVRDAIRSLSKAPGFVTVVVLTLAVGVGATTAIFGVLHAVVLRDLPYRDSDRLALIWTLNIRQNIRDGVSFLNFRDWKEQSRGFEDMAVFRRPEFTVATITGGQEPERIHVALVGPGFFRVLGSSALEGRTLDDSPGAPADRPVVISHGLWRQRFAGDASVVGRPIEIDGMTGVVVGVMPVDFAFPAANVRAWLPISVQMDLARAAANPRSRGGDPLVTIGRLSPGHSLRSARAEMDVIAERLRTAYPDDNADRGVLIEPLREHLLGPRTERALWLLLGAVALVLLIACANVTNLTLARGAARRHEFSLRAALGASRTRLIRQTLIESLLLCGLAAGAGMFIASLAAAALRTLASTALPRLDTMQLGPVVLGFALAVSLCGVVASLLPALRLSAVSGSIAIAEAGPRATGGLHARRLRRGLVVSEIALSVVLLSGAGLLVRSFLRVQAADRGYDSGHMLLLQVDLPRKYDGQARKADYFRNAFDRIKTLPGVTAAGAVDDFFVSRHGDLRVVVEGGPPPGPAAPRLIRNRVIPGYFEAAGIPLLEGRFLQDGDLVEDLDREQPKAVVINDAMARQFWAGASPVGKRIVFGSNPGPGAPWARVVGVVADMRREGLDRPDFPCIFSPGFGSQMDVVVRTTGDPVAMRDAVRAQLLAVDPDVPPYGVVGVEQRLGETVAVRTLQTLLLATLAMAALVLAVIGVYGLIRQSVASRTQEIGVRMALGATRLSIVRLVLGTALAPAVAGLGIGLAAAVVLRSTISVFLYETSPSDPVTFVVVPLVLLFASIAACLPTARLAALLDPSAVLRGE